MKRVPENVSGLFVFNCGRECFSVFGVIETHLPGATKSPRLGRPLRGKASGAIGVTFKNFAPSVKQRSA